MTIKEIQSLQHSFVKFLIKLRTDKKIRTEYRQVLVIGTKMVEEHQILDCLIVQKGSNYSKKLKAKEYWVVSEAVLKKITGVENPEPIAGVVAMPPWDLLHGKNWILGLDNISDPGNLGTLLRSALALDWEGVFMTQGSADPYNDKALRSAKGATFRIPMRMGTQEELLDWADHEKMSPVVADLDGTPLNEWQSKKRTLLILGNESLGISPIFKKKFPSITIPIKKMESLNVATAGAILMYSLKL